MGFRDCTCVIFYLLLIYVEVPFSYGTEVGHQEFTDSLSVGLNEDQPFNRHLRSSSLPLNKYAYDNHKPVLDCSRYNASVDEEKTKFTYVTTVRATDEDINDKITYRFQQRADDKAKFTINSETGIILTNDVFDRDDISARQKEIYVTVLATDNGIPNLFDVCTFKITINDVNDNDPVFDKSAYSESIPVDLPVGQEVIRIYATDNDDGNNSVIEYSLMPGDEFTDFFGIEKATGIITLKKGIPKDLVGKKMNIRARAQDKGEPPRSSYIDIYITVVDSSKKKPQFTTRPPPIIELNESYRDFEKPIVTLTAESNIPDHPAVAFQIMDGKTGQTNMKKTFILQQITDNNHAILKLAQPLDYESITEFTITIKASNDDFLTDYVNVVIKVLDVNDNIPSFMELATETEVSGSVPENEPAGTVVMTVQATDKDGTSPNNKVYYELADHTDLFIIDRITGEIRTLKEFDREETEFYNIKVKAIDGAPSSLYKSGAPNEAEQVFRIRITDKNDNAPVFTKSVYPADDVSESTDTNKLIIEVKAVDKDTASELDYRIIDGNKGEAFSIDKTGRITVKNRLDYETEQSYTLKILAYDGFYNDTAEVIITIKNENDEVPVFDEFDKKVTIEEESIPDGCLVTVRATDPDRRRDEDQRIIYKVDANTNFLEVGEKSGCVKLTKELDRDPPNGSQQWQALITARDENGEVGSQQQSVDFFIVLQDINDNAPVLNITEVVWNEQQPAEMKIITLTAVDNDIDPNGPPFSFFLANDASDEIKEKFYIKGSDLWPRVVFDREEKKEYLVPISIIDNGNPPLTGPNTLKVIIGDENDNPMSEGESVISVISLDVMPDTIIGRVYVEDLDDWDLPDKVFRWKSDIDKHFFLNKDTGEITLLNQTPPGTYILSFTVTEKSKYVPEHSVNAKVTVNIKQIKHEAIEKSGSIRLQGISAENFIEVHESKISMKDNMQQQLARVVNASLENLDILSVLHFDNKKNMLDIRYSAHGSPYYYPEMLNTLVTLKSDTLDFAENVFLVNIAECLDESVCAGHKYSCTNYLNISSVPFVVNTNKTSFVGISAVVEPICECMFRDNREPRCLNGGEFSGENTNCECQPGYEGPHCEALSISFLGNGYAMYPSFETCSETKIILEIITRQSDGLIFYVGPLRKNYKDPVKDFMSLELRDGYLVLLLDYGSGTRMYKQDYKRLDDGEQHVISISLWTKFIEITIDHCENSSCYRQFELPPGSNKALNVNGPLQVGGSVVNLHRLAEEFNWEHKPTINNFIGCISNLRYNNMVYDLGTPRYGQHFYKDCNNLGPQAAAFGIDSNFLVALLVCLAILLILLLAVVVHRRKHDHWNEKELDDIRETIINYEDEGGGEHESPGFDLELLRRESHFDEPIKKHNDMYYGRAPEEVPDINGFLQDKKDACDKDPDFNPFDDVRYYAYEGDGNTSRSSLSSLASCTDEGDLKFNYLSNFGPRFRKLADMYGEEPSDDEENEAGEESWC